MDIPTLTGASGTVLVLLTALGQWQRRIDARESDRVLRGIADAHDRGTHRAIAQHPIIEPLSCIGCGSCIAACPESGVIGLVHGIAHVVHGSRCIGHGRCADMCPVGALQVGLGDVTGRADLPVLDEELMTTVPGIFLAGELGGIALIRNAIEQGVRAVDSAARFVAAASSGSRSEGGDGDAVDVLIVGAGPAGLAATLRARELGLVARTVSRDDLGGTVRKYPRRKLTMTQPVDLPLAGRMNKHQYIKEELIKLWDGIAGRLGVEVSVGEQLLGCTREGDLLLTRTSAREHRSRAVVLALGRRGVPRRLGVPGEEVEKVLYQLMDAATYRECDLLVVGGGDSAVEAAMALANQPGNRVTLAYRKRGFFRLKPRNEERIHEYAATARVDLRFETQVREIRARDIVLGSTAEGGGAPEALANDYTFVFAGGEPPYPLLRGMGIRFGDQV